MPPITEPVVIVLKYTADAGGKAALAPAKGKRTPVPPGATVIFALGDPGATSLTVTFPNNSPFGDVAPVQTVKGGDAHRVEREVNASDPKANVYIFDCTAIINGTPVAAKGGGEIEIGP